MKTLHWRGKTLKNSKELGTLWQFSMALWLQTLSVFRSVEELNGGRQFRVIHQQSLTWTTQNQYTVTALSVALREDYLRAIIPIHRKPLLETFHDDLFRLNSKRLWNDEESKKLSGSEETFCQRVFFWGSNNLAPLSIFQRTLKFWFRISVEKKLNFWNSPERSATRTFGLLNGLLNALLIWLQFFLDYNFAELS